MKRTLIILFALLCIPSGFAAITSYQDAVRAFADPTTLDASIPASVRPMLGTNEWRIIVGGAGIDYYWMTTVNGHVTATGRGRRLSPNPTALVMTTRQTLDQILASATPGPAAVQAVQQGRILIQYRSATQGVRTRLGLGAIRLGIINAQYPAGAKEPGELCQHGGECRTGNCVGIAQGPPWSYGCSCDPFRYVASGC